ncbi:ATP-dependent nuclease [Candidatus Poriferisodalis sp.]|uniref:ATP-dependent nuclease n=1 Tax=Candidatus Poriferisodalis sp. TaxID=3101277 RepID=UPI003B026163
MRISRISISNHHRVDDVDIEVRDHVVFVGPNAIGKSTILRLLDLVLGATWGSLAASLDAGQLRDPEHPLVVEVRLEHFDDSEKAHFADKIEVGTGSNEGNSWLTARLSASVSSVDPDRLEIHRDFVKPSVKDMSISRDDLIQIGWSYLAANRSPDRELGSGRTSAVRSLLSAVALDDTGASDIGQALSGLSEALVRSTALGELRTELAVGLSSVYPTPLSPDDVSIDLPRSTTEEPLADLDVKVDRGLGAVPLAAQSDGLRSLTTVAVQLLARKSSKIIAIDEPEIHLHPRSQASLAKLLILSKGQSVIATHAAPVLSQYLPEHAVALSHQGCGQLARAHFAGNTKHYQHWWVDSALEPLTAESIVFVEGVSDRIIFSAIAAHLGIDLNKLNVTVVPLNGAGNFAPAIRLFGTLGFGKRLLGLVDDAEAHLPAKALDIAIGDLKAHDFFVSSVDLEDEYTRSLGVTDTVALLTGSQLFSEGQILASAGVSALSSLTAEDVAEFARRNKVEAATAIASDFTSVQASSIRTVVELVKRAARQ